MDEQLDMLTITPEEMEAAQAAITKQRAEIAAEQERRDKARRALDVATDDLDAATEAYREAYDDDEEDEAAVPAWPHQTMVYMGHEFQVRKPGDAALIAVSMSSDPSLGPQVQVTIFAQFLRSHLSHQSYVEALLMMSDPDSEATIQGLVTALTQVQL